jgi:acyl-CoA reductase-like NAD-dependent aldehyde dehydrogenase
MMASAARTGMARGGQMGIVATRIGGQERQNGRLVPVVNPWDGAMLAEVREATAQDVEEALTLGNSLQVATHAGLSAFEKRRILEKTRALLELHAEELALLIQQEAGKPIALARGEVRRAQDTFAFTAMEVGRDGELLDLGRSEFGKGRWGLVRRFPRGLVSAITPFNFPLNLVAHKLAPAIAAGCPIVIKPSPQAPLSAFRLVELVLESGLPPPYVSILMPAVADMAPLVSDKRVKVFTFTGSAAVGWQLKAQAVQQQVALELGGNAAVLVCEDADLDQAVKSIATGAFSYAGQSCISVQRVFVQSNVQVAFSAKLLRHVQDHWQAGDPALATTLCGPVISDAAADRIAHWQSQAIAAGAQLLVGGTREGRMLQPTVLTGVSHEQPLWQEEAFGPVKVVEPFTALQDALTAVNASRFGLQVGIFTQDITSAWQAFEQAHVGAVIHNDVPTTRYDQMPYGGVNDSGMGREGPRYALEEYTEPRLLVLKPGT